VDGRVTWQKVAKSGAGCACRFGVTLTPVGGFANGPKGIPVLRTDTSSDSEVTGIADDGLGSQRPSLFEGCLIREDL
jgi:hypothetical protein